MKKENEQKKLIMLFIGAFLIMIFMMIFSHKAAAASPKLPIYVDRNDFLFGVDFYQNYINNAYGGFWNLKGDNVIGWASVENGQVLQTFAVWQNQSIPFAQEFHTNLNNIANPSILNNVYPNYDWQNNTITLTFTGLSNSNYTCIRIFTFYVNLQTQNVNVVAFNQSNIVNVGLYGNTGKKLNYVSNPIYYSYSGGNYPQFMLFSSNLEDFEPEPGETVEPDFDNLDEGLTKPTFPTKPTTTAPTPSNAPSIDTSSQQAFWQSIGDLISWGFTTLRNFLAWIGTLIKDWIEYIGEILGYIGDLIEYWLEIIKRTITNLGKNLYQNFTYFFKPLIDKINDTISGIKTTVEDFADLFINPFDEEEFEQQIADCQLITQYNTLVSNCERIQQIFDYAEEKNHFSLYIDFENPFADSEHKIIHGEINFDWLVPLRGVYRPFLWVFTLFECFVGGMRVLGNIIGGKAK